MTMSEMIIHAVRVSDAQLHQSGFRPMLGGEQPSPNKVATDTSEPDPYTRGFDEGQRAAAAAFATERAALMQLIGAAQALMPEPSEELAALIGEAVERLVSEIVGTAAIDRDWLNTQAKRAASLVAECDAARTMWLHPDDLGLIEGDAIGLTLMPDPAAERGSMRIDCSAGWIEHGTALYLDELRCELGLKGHGA
jgi:flagellar assembly protein FliH